VLVVYERSDTGRQEVLRFLACFFVYKFLKLQFYMTQTSNKLRIQYHKICVLGNVADPNPYDPYVFGPPGSASGSIS
jgi:hypothetical protein